MDVPKGFKPDGKDLDGHMERLLEPKPVKKPLTTKIEEAFNDYVNKRKHTAYLPRVPELVQYVGEIKDFSLFVKELCEPQLEGKLPLIKTISTYYEGVTPCTYDIYWNPEKERLEFDWDDTPGAKERLNQYKQEIDFWSQ